MNIEPKERFESFTEIIELTALNVEDLARLFTELDTITEDLTDLPEVGPFVN